MGSNVVGLDIGSTAVRAVELNAATKTRPVLVRFHEIRLPVGAVSRGEVIDAVVVGSTLKKLWSEGGFKSKKVVLGTGDEHVLVRDLTVPKMPLRQIRESLPFQVHGVVQTPIADALLDFYPISESTGEQGLVVNGLLVATDKNAVLANIRAVERAGLTPVDVDLIPFALNRLLIGRPQIEGTIALIDIGAHTTSIIVVIDAVPRFVRIIPTGGDELTQALKSGLEIGTDEAEELKKNLVLGAGSKGDSQHYQCECDKCAAETVRVVDPRALDILQAPAAELLGSLRSTVNYFNNNWPQDPIQQVLVTGGGAQLAGFTEALSALAHVAVTHADPFSSITIPRRMKGENPQDSQVAITVALGLALRSMS